MGWFKRSKNDAPVKKSKKENRFPAVRLFGAAGAVLFEGPLNELRFSEKLVIAKSVFFFNDPEPCFIHRSAVAARLFGELNLLLENQGELSLAGLGESCSGYFDEYPGAEIIRVIKEGLE
jgi:hypothetical protein